MVSPPPRSPATNCNAHTGATVTASRYPLSRRLVAEPCRVQLPRNPHVLSPPNGYHSHRGGEPPRPLRGVPCSPTPPVFPDRRQRETPGCRARRSCGERRGSCLQPVG